jgi:DNA polymerase I-like protein with 3'-5' exonuclease and polymerase domains/5'-3' exonuclease
MKLIVDFSSLLWTCLLTGKDVEGFECEDENGKVHWVNTHMYAYEFAVNSIKAALDTYNLAPIDMVLVVEGMSSKAQRVFINKDYKANRGRRPKEAYEEFSKLKELLLETFKSLGAIAVTQEAVEADDIIAWIAKNTKCDVVVMSNDNDLLTLAGVNEYGAKITARIGGEENYNKYGLFPLQYVTLYKALVGDSGDNIKGVTGFGEAAWKDFHAQFGEDGMAEMVRLAKLGTLDELESDAEQNKIAKKIYDGRDQFLTSWKLASMHPEWIDTMSEPLSWQPGMVTYKGSDERLKHWAAASRLVTADKWEAFKPWFFEQIKHRDWLALDIETSTPNESDDWLEAQGSKDGVDVIGSELTGMSLTFGKNMQYTVYIPVDHEQTNNVDKALVGELLYDLQKLGKEIVIQNTSFEGTVLFNEFGESWKDLGNNGLLMNWLDTKFEASYVDENNSLGLKHLSKKWLGYDQVNYNEVTTVDGVQHKMRELTAQHVFSYACDDTITTAALHNFFKLFMELEGTWDVYKQVEIDASYLHVQSFIHGTKISLQTLQGLRTEDETAEADAWKVVRQYLIEKGWEGTATPVYSGDLKAADIKQAVEIVTGEPLVTQVRTPSKLLEMISDHLLKDSVAKAISGEFEQLNKLVASRFKGEPVFNMGSTVQKTKLLYEVMGLPVRVYNKPTDAAKARGERQGTAKTDNLSIMYALKDAEDREREVLNALRVMQMVSTRRSLYYDTYGNFVHWKTGRIHSSHNQCATNTRRASSSSPNIQQVAKNAKVEGYSPRIREVYVPHKKNAVIVSMDFMAQELRVIADYSKDKNMVACFVGDNLKDMHALTGLGIYNSRNTEQLSYQEFVEALESREHNLHKDVKKMRALGKQCNFTTEFGAQASKLATTMFVSEQEAQTYIDAKEAAFPTVVQWKDCTIAEAKQCGYVRTKLGAKRHLRELFKSQDRYVASKAERQAVNFKVQSSSAEMTKLAEGRMWRARLEQRFDCEIVGPCHDEVIASVALDDLHEFIPAMHSCMVQQYADMEIPVKSSISFGQTFGPAHQIEIGELPTREAVEKGLAQLEKSMA